MFLTDKGSPAAIWWKLCSRSYSGLAFVWKCTNSSLSHCIYFMQEFTALCRSVLVPPPRVTAAPHSLRDCGFSEHLLNLDWKTRILTFHFVSMIPTSGFRFCMLIVFPSHFLRFWVTVLPKDSKYPRRQRGADGDAFMLFRF